MNILNPTIKRGGPTRDREIFYIMKILRMEAGAIGGEYARWAMSLHPNPIPPRVIEIFTRSEDSTYIISSALTRLKWKPESRAVMNGQYYSFNCGGYPLAVWISRWIFGNPTKILTGIDFTINQVLLTPDCPLCTPEFLRDEQERRLVVHRVSNSILSRFERLRDMGYTIDPENLEKIMGTRTTERAWSRHEYSRRTWLGWDNLIRDFPQSALEAYQMLEGCVVRVGSVIRAYVDNGQIALDVTLTENDLAFYRNTPYLVEARRAEIESPRLRTTPGWTAYPTSGETTTSTVSWGTSNYTL